MRILNRMHNDMGLKGMLITKAGLFKSKHCRAQVADTQPCVDLKISKQQIRSSPVRPFHKFAFSSLADTR